MILESTFNALLLIGTAITLISFRQLIDPRLGGVLSVVIWSLLTANAFDVVTEAQSSTVAMESTAILTGGLAAVMLIFTAGALAGQLPTTNSSMLEVNVR